MCYIGFDGFIGRFEKMTIWWQELLRAYNRIKLHNKPLCVWITSLCMHNKRRDNYRDVLSAENYKGGWFWLHFQPFPAVIYPHNLWILSIIQVTWWISLNDKGINVSISALSIDFCKVKMDGNRGNYVIG